MIEANAANLQSFLKDSGGAVPAVSTAAAVTTPPNPLEAVNNGVQNTTDSLDKFTNLLEAVNKLLSQPIVKGAMEKGIDRKAAPVEQTTPQPAQEVAPEIPEGYNDINSNAGFSEGGLPPPSAPPKEELKESKAKFYFDALFKTVEVMADKEPERTIKEIFDEMSNEAVQEQLIKQIEVLENE